jgi:hypothetical protein
MKLSIDRFDSPFRRLTVVLVLATMSFAAVPTWAVAAETNLLEITVIANETKANKAPWDGFEGGGAGRAGIFFGAPTSGPPDLAVCVVLPMAGETECQSRKEGKKIYSFCQNSFDCDFHKVRVPPGVFGLVIVDIDLASNDLVDFLIVSSGGEVKESEISLLEAKTRAEANRLAPPFTQGEKQRREREILKFAVSDCRGAPCTLRQSKLLLKWTQ